jgi:hypothetical protein
LSRAATLTGGANFRKSEKRKDGTPARRRTGSCAFAPDLPKIQKRHPDITGERKFPRQRTHKQEGLWKPVIADVFKADAEAVILAGDSATRSMSAL